MDEKEIRKDLEKDTCLCGATKESGHSFCRMHFYRLTPDMRRSLYRNFHAGYERAFEKAARQLGIWPADSPAPEPERMAA